MIGQREETILLLKMTGHPDPGQINNEANGNADNKPDPINGSKCVHGWINVLQEDSSSSVGNSNGRAWDR